MIFLSFLFLFVNSFHFFFLKEYALFLQEGGEKSLEVKQEWEIKRHFNVIISPLEGLTIQANDHPPYSTETLIFQRERASSNIMSEKLIQSRTLWDS